MSDDFSEEAFELQGFTRLHGRICPKNIKEKSRIVNIAGQYATELRYFKFTRDKYCFHNFYSSFLLDSLTWLLIYSINWIMVEQNFFLFKSFICENNSSHCGQRQATSMFQYHKMNF